MKRQPGCLLLVLVSAAGLCGCGGGGDMPELVPLTGKVSLGGKPLENAQVMFVPTEGRPSIAYTDASGEFEMQYKEGEPGVKPGPGKLAITTLLEPDPDSEDPVRQKGRKEEAPEVVTTIEKTPIKVEAREDMPPLEINLDEYK